MALAFAALAILLFGARTFTVGLGGADWLEATFGWASLAAAHLSGWRTALHVRRWRSRRREAASQPVTGP
jgi:hypothetical protein